jgi:RNA polymerase-binding transcription factor DksA
MLLRLRQRLTVQSETLKGESLVRNDSVVSREDGTDVFERHLALSLVSAERDVIFEIDDALRRLDQGEYGICESCSMPIEKPRLEALPFVKMCVACKAAAERGRPRFRPL